MTMNEESSFETVPMKKPSAPDMVNAGTGNEDTVPPSSGIGTQTTDAGYKGLDAKAINPPKRATGGKPAFSRSLLGGALGLSVIASGAAAYSFSTRYPIPAEEALASGTDPVSSLVRDKLKSQKAANDEEMENLKKEYLVKLQAAERSVESTRGQQTADLEKLNADLKLKDDEIKKIQDTLANHDADHAQEIAANKLKVDELEKNASMDKDRLNEALAKQSADPSPKVVLATKPPILPSMENEKEDERRSLPTKRAKETAMRESSRPEPMVSLIYGLDSRSAKQYWYFIAPDGSASERFPSRQLAISSAESRIGGSQSIHREVSIHRTK